MQRSPYKFLILLVCAAWAFISFDVLAQSSSFAKLQFGETIFLEVPRNWEYSNKQIRQHLDTGSEAVGRLAGFPVAQGDNQILLAANAYTSSKTLSATLRLSVRPGAAPTQADVQEFAKYPKAELNTVFGPMLSETAQLLRSMEGVEYVKALDSRVESNGYINCIFIEFEYAKSDGISLSQSWLCPMGNKAIKLSTSYRKNEAALLKPVIMHVWKSLRASNDAPPHAHEKTINPSNELLEVQHGERLDTGTTGTTMQMQEFDVIDFILSIIFTWTIGLLPPVVIRYVIVKYPMDKGSAIITSVAFWFFNLFFFISLGSQSKSHMVLSLIAYVSYLILRKPTHIKLPQIHPQVTASATTGIQVNEVLAMNQRGQARINSEERRAVGL